MLTLDNIVEKYGIKKLNSLTKYPSILVYHEMGDKGILKNCLTEKKSFSDYEKCFITEKIDGTNSRIIFFNGDFFIGSREEFLYSKGDRFCNPSLNIVNTIKQYAEKICSNIKSDNCMYVIFGETYGGKITSSSKQYTNDGTCNFRLFDIFLIDEDLINLLLEKPIHDISLWRENNEQKFYNVNKIKEFADMYNIETVPYIEEKSGNDIPINLKDTYEWLLQFKLTHAGINNNGNSEGVVIRDFNRRFIRKLRFEDYEKTKKYNIF